MINEEIILNNQAALKENIDLLWSTIAPTFPIKNIIAVNPLKGYENIFFENAIKERRYFFKSNKDLKDIKNLNIETIKWCQAFFDIGQSTIEMPFRELGFYYAFKKLIYFDNKLNKKQKKFILNLPNDPISAISICITELHLSDSQVDLILKTLLMTLPGWAGYIKYKSNWDPVKSNQYKLIEYDYVAIRFILFFIFLKNTSGILTVNEKDYIHEIKNYEKKYHQKLIKKLLYFYKNERIEIKKAKAQFIFCIDVRSEPFRRAIEKQGNYETFGFAGFFGLPICIKSVDSEKHNSCPILMKSQHTIEEHIDFDKTNDYKKTISKNKNFSLIKKIYQSLKYNFTTPFLLAEFLGFWSGLWMITKTFMPQKASLIKRKINPQLKKSLITNKSGILEGISFSEQVKYASDMLKSIDLVDSFAPVVVLCGHGSSTQNNAYASALDCGACGGHDGGTNARVMCAILNTKAVQHELKKTGIDIPDNTQFIAGLHNTTTDEITFFSEYHYPELKEDLKKAKVKNNQKRSKKLFYKKNMKLLSEDWAETRPEWGLAKNAGFIIGPRNYTQKIDLDGRCFLHSYNWEKDQNLTILTNILTGPTIVAQWINAQYLFSTLDPIAYGSGSKTTQNITGKIGIMQGNASDLMHGLPLQSTHISDHEKFHEPIRLITVIYAPRDFIVKVIYQNETLTKLTKNEWIKLYCIDPTDKKSYHLKTDLSWEMYEHI